MSKFLIFLLAMFKIMLIIVNCFILHQDLEDLYMFTLLPNCSTSIVSIVTMLLLRTPVGTGARQCTTWYSYLGV